MTPSRTINLIESKTAENPQLDKINALLKRASYLVVLALVASGIIVGGLFTYLQYRNAQLTDQQNTLITGITQDAAKESLLVAMKERIAVVDKIMANQKKVSTLFSLLTDIVPTANLSSVSLDDANKVTVTATVGSVPEAVSLVDSILALGQKGKLTKAALASFGLSDTGGLEISVSFVPVL